MTTSTSTSTSPGSGTAATETSGGVGRWFVDPANLNCPGCGEQVRCAPPAYWQVADGLPVAQFSHPDATALCRTAGGRVGEPVEVTR